MKTYMDGNYIVAGETIISYTGERTGETVPERFGNISVSEIGYSAFMQSYNLTHVKLPPGIKKLGSNAFEECIELESISVPGTLSHIGLFVFRKCDSLSDITIYDMELTSDEYYSLKNSAVLSNNGIYVTKKAPQIELVQKLTACVMGHNVTYTIPDGIPMLFHLTNSDDEKGKFKFHKEIQVLGYSKPFFEGKVFFERRAEPDINELSGGKAEAEVDRYVRTGKACHKNRCAIFTFDDTKTREENGNFLICASLKIGYFFWQSSQPVMYEGKKYYIYRRHYLNPGDEFRFVRRDIAVYSDKGLVTDKKEAQEVYAKYRLLSIL